MSMTKSRRREILAHWRSTMMRWDTMRESILRALDDAIGRVEPEGPLFTLLCEQQGEYTKAVAELVGDTTFGWLEWYAYENDYGRKGHPAAARECDKLRPIRTVAQLARLIEVAE